MSAKSKGTGKELGFGEAMEELEAILGRVEGDEIDIDELAEELKQATKLLELCRQKIRKAELEVTQIVQSLEEPEKAAGDSGEESSDSD
ncbi:MAG: exodeoxyribonuclease VII small subunit [Acidobacteria bacterium]|nr:MAG: exodeoxyribonuclease VII small subunit [Acidobacteriota bacterium]